MLLLALLFFCYLMVQITLPYLLPPFPTNIDFLLTKQDKIDIDYWMVAFYVHISSSFFVLLSGATQFSKYLLKKHPIIHRNIGKVYVALILFVSAPSGLIMAFHSNGGIPGKTGFIVLALLWWIFTFLAYKTIRNKNVLAHGKWMFRSYAVTLSAITLRAISFSAGLLMIPVRYEDIYVFSAWGSWGFNLIIAEILILLGAVNYYIKSGQKNLTSGQNT